MKARKLLPILLFLIVTCAIPTYGQVNEPYLKKVTTSVNQTLSTEMQNKLNKLKSEKYHKELNLVKIGDFKKSLRNETLTIDIPGAQGARIEARTKYFDFTLDSEFLWYGEFKNGDVILISKEGRTFGQVRIKNRVFKIEYLENDIAAVIQHDMDMLNQMDCATSEDSKKEPSKLSSRVNQENQAYSTQSLTQPVVRVLVLFTPAAQNTGQNINDVVDLALGQFVSAEVNSQVTINLQLAGIQSLDFTETGVIDDDKVSLRNNITAQQLRNDFEADIVLLLTNGNYPGVSGAVVQVGPSEPNAYGIVEIAHATSTLTFAHEAAHLFGCRHQIANDTTPGDAHGHGWETGIWPFQSKFGTIMFIRNKAGTKVTHFSNPGINYDGQPTGITGESFNAKTLNFNGWVLQDFRFSTPDLVVDIQGPGSANNGDPLEFTSSVYNGQSPYSYVWQANIGGGYYTAGYSSSLNMTMPTDNDLELILTVTDGNSQQASDYTFVRNNFLGGGCTVCPDSTMNDVIAVDSEADEKPELNRINVYPNPASDKLTIRWNDELSSESKFQIVDNNGLVVFEIQWFSSLEGKNYKTLDISGLKRGVYFLKSSDGNSYKTVRFIKK